MVNRQILFILNFVINLLKKIGLFIFRLVYKSCRGLGLGKISFVNSVYEHLYILLKPKGFLQINIMNSQIKFKLDTTDTPNSMTADLLLSQDFSSEAFETRLFCELIRPGMVVVDIGANIGYYSLIGSQLVGKKGKVYALEPDPSNFDMLLKNIQANNYKNIIPSKKAVGDHSGHIRLYMSEHASGHSIGPLPQSIGSILVPIERLDDFFIGKLSPINLVKMDIEGAEMLAFKGMGKIIEANRGLKILTEFFPRQLESCGSSPVSYFNQIKDSGFMIYIIDELESQTIRAYSVEDVIIYMEKARTDHINLLLQQ